jgi:CRISPR/Cas system CSM-associated protein Csm3 (group 7 of RAMP superfamily)
MNNARAIFDDALLPQFETRTWVESARAIARRIAAERGQVTIDDVRVLCPPPEGADPRIMGSVFAGGQFAQVGRINSSRRECHGRSIGVFALKDGASAQAGATRS